MKRSLTVLALLSVPIVTAGLLNVQKPTAAAQETRPKDDKSKAALQKFMRAKLAASSQVLEGLTTGDFRLITEGAKELQRVSSAEEWRISNDAMYRQHSAQFQRIVEQLEQNARDKNLDGAALSWMEGTMSCIECHKWVRAVLVAEKR